MVGIKKGLKVDYYLDYCQALHCEPLAQVMARALPVFGIKICIYIYIYKFRVHLNVLRSPGHFSEDEVIFNCLLCQSGVLIYFRNVILSLIQNSSFLTVCNKKILGTCIPVFF